MLTFEEARKIGIRVCVDMLGYDFVKKYEDTACSAYGDEGDHASCFVGVNTEPEKPWTGGTLILDDSPNSKYPYSASCNVDYADGAITGMTLTTPAMA